MNRSLARWLAATAIGGLAATALVAPAATAAGPADTSFCADGSVPMVPQSEVVETFDETTSITGLTVVKGTTPVEFTGTYVGHLENALGKGADMLLFKLSGAGIDAADRPAGIWAGMSGSPVYTADGRLVGAVSYGLSGDTIPIAGVTPASYMKQVGADRLAAPAKVAVKARNLQAASPRSAAALAGQTYQRLKTVKVIAGGARGNALANRTQARVPNHSASAASARAGDFAPLAAPTEIAEPLAPGGNIAVGYSTGDLFSGGIGTVTAICGSTVWAFGHPMDFMGQTSLSIHNASAALVVTDGTGWGSYKQVSKVGQQIGTITHDGFGAIRGELGLIRGFPVTTTVKNASGAVLDTYRGTVVDPWMASNAALAPALAVWDILDNFGIGHAKLSWKIGYRTATGRSGVLANRQVYSGLGDLADQLAGGMGDDIASLAYTDLADVTITSVTSTLTLLGDQAADYRVSGAQWWNGAKWVKLKGKKLKPGKHKVRPMIRQYVNGKPKAAVPGAVSTFKLGKLATGRGKVTFSARAEESSGECVELDGEMFCDDFGEGVDEPKNFTALLRQLDQLVLADRGLMQAQWKWKQGKATGKSQRTAKFTAPGVLTGSYKATFTIRR